jgi:hypothetical protein
MVPPADRPPPLEVSMTTPGEPADARALGVEPRTMDAVLGA